MNIFFLVLGTIMAAVFVVMLFRGGKYDYMLEPLKSEDFPAKEIYSVGLAMQEIPVTRLRGKLGAALRENATLYYGKQYSEFYARIMWAQTLTFAVLCLAVMFLLAGMSSGDTMAFYAVVGLIAAAVFSYYFLTSTKEKIEKRKSACEEEFPNAISKLALLVNSGVILHTAWEMVAYGKTGMLYDLMQKACEDMKNGKSDIDAIYEFGTLCGSDNIKKFSTALIQSIERGGGELPIFLTNQSSELWAEKRQLLLQKGTKAASALLAPIGLMFAGIMLIVVSAAMQSFSI